MSLPYVPGHIIDECKDLRRQGCSITMLAGQIGVSAEDLAAILGEPAWKQVPQDSNGTDFCLFEGCERLQAQL